MRIWVAAVLLVAACTTAEPQQSAPPASNPSYGDARSAASDADVGAARRAYRAACERHSSTARCECLTGGMAQVLAPADLNAATAALNGQSGAASSEARARIAAEQSQAEHACTAYPR